LVPLAALLLAVAWAVEEAAKDSGTAEISKDNDEEGDEEGHEDEEEQEAVMTLKSSNFDDVVAKSERVLVEFYAPWCGHCKALEPEYKQAAEQMKAEGLSTVLAKVDATEESQVAGRYDVSGYPTLIYFVGGKQVQKYEGERTTKGIKAWLTKREKPDVQTISKEDQTKFGEDTPEGEFSMVAHVKEQSARGKAYMQAANEHLIDFEAATIRKALIPLPKSADPKADARLTFYRPNFAAPDELRIPFTGSWTSKNIAKWAKASIYPTVLSKFEPAKLTSTILEDMGWSGFVVALVDDANLDDEEADKAIKQKMREQLVELAQVEKKWKFVVAEISETEESHLEQLGAQKSSLPMLSVVADGKKYVLAGDDMVKAGAAKDFLTAVKSKKVKPHYKSAATPSPEVDSNEVTVLVGETFEKHVLDSKKDVFVEFYAPWCGHCKKLTPVWEELARKSKDAGWKDRGLVIAKMDATENECEEQVTGFPTLVLYPAVKSERKFRQKLTYSGARELAPMVDFLLENSKNLDGIEDSSRGDEKKPKSMVERELEKKKRKKEQEL